MSPRPLALHLLSAWILVALAAAIGADARAGDWPSKVPKADERGRELYDRHCVACHGPTAAGDGPAAAALAAPVPDLSAGLGKTGREELVRTVMRGRGVMPGYDQAFRDLKPWDDTPASYARNVLDHMDRLARGLVEPVEDPAADEDEDDDQDDAADAP